MHSNGQPPGALVLTHSAGVVPYSRGHIHAKPQGNTFTTIIELELVLKYHITNIE